MNASHHRINCITPPYVLERLLESDDSEIRRAALDTLMSTAHLRGARTLGAGLALEVGGVDTAGRRTIFDCHHAQSTVAAVQVRAEEGSSNTDASVNRAFDGLGATRDFYREVLARNSIDDHGLPLKGYVHYGTRFNNAFWSVSRMVFGDGDGRIFTDFTRSLDVIAHELTHGVTEHTAGLEYERQSGALNESISDVFGSLVKQWSRKQTVEQADWLIGAEVFTPGIDADALRSMKAPGTAFDNDLFGKDPQPDHMSRYVNLPVTEQGDWGGVHINSGIPNKAFYLAATSIGGNAWAAPGHIWYEALKASNSTTEFQEFADITNAKAGALCGAGSREQEAVRGAWQQVGIQTARVPSLAADGAEFGEQLAFLTKQIESLSERLDAIFASSKP